MRTQIPEWLTSIFQSLKQKEYINQKQLFNLIGQNPPQTRQFYLYLQKIPRHVLSPMRSPWANQSYQTVGVNPIIQLNTWTTSSINIHNYMTTTCKIHMISLKKIKPHQFPKCSFIFTIDIDSLEHALFQKRRYHHTLYYRYLDDIFGV